MQLNLAHCMSPQLIAAKCSSMSLSVRSADGAVEKPGGSVEKLCHRNVQGVLTLLLWDKDKDKDNGN